MQVQTFAYQPNVVLDGSGPLSRIQRVHEKMGNCLAWRFTTAAQWAAAVKVNETLAIGNGYNESVKLLHAIVLHNCGSLSRSIGLKLNETFAIGNG